MYGFEPHLALVLMVLLLWTPFLVFILGSGSVRLILLYVLYNAITLTVFCGLWYSGFYVSEYWMRIIDLGAPWSWLTALFLVSYIASLLPLRKQSQIIWKPFAGPMVTLPLFYIWIKFCDIMFDPFY